MKAGILHEKQAGYAQLLRRLTVDLIHLLRGKDFHTDLGECACTADRLTGPWGSAYSLS